MAGSLFLLLSVLALASSFRVRDRAADLTQDPPAAPAPAAAAEQPEAGSQASGKIAGELEYDEAKGVFDLDLLGSYKRNATSPAHQLFADFRFTPQQREAGAVSRLLNEYVEYVEQYVPAGWTNFAYRQDGRVLLGAVCAGCDLNATYAKFLARHNEHLKSLKFQNNNTVAVIEHPAKGQVAFQGELGSQPTAAVAATDDLDSKKASVTDYAGYWGYGAELRDIRDPADNSTAWRVTIYHQHPESEDRAQAAIDKIKEHSHHHGHHYGHSKH